MIEKWIVYNPIEQILQLCSFLLFYSLLNSHNASKQNLSIGFSGVVGFTCVYQIWESHTN